MYLLMIRCLMDDYPVQMFEGRKPAMDTVGTLTRVEVLELARQRADMFSHDPSEPVCWALVRFADCVPVESATYDILD